MQHECTHVSSFEIYDPMYVKGAIVTQRNSDGHCLFLVLLLMNGSSERSCLAYVKCPDLYLRTRTGPLFCPNLFCPISFFIFHFITLLKFYFKSQLNTFSNSVFSHDLSTLESSSERRASFNAFATKTKINQLI